MEQDLIFSNTEKKPLGELTFQIVDGGAKLNVSALNKRWVEKVNFPLYKTLILSGGYMKTEADLEEWMYESEIFNENLKFLLNLRQYKFWSYLIFEKRVINGIVSFLQESTPFYLNLTKLTDDTKVLNLYFEILENVLRIICRIITNKESEEEWIAKDHLKELIYSNFLISIPMLFDLIMACGESNFTILKRIFETIFKIEPLYNRDLKLSLQYFPVAFKKIKLQAENNGQDDENGGAAGGVIDLEILFNDLVLLTLDCAYTISILVDIYPEARVMCNEINLEPIISNFYDTTIPHIYQHINLINSDSPMIMMLNEARIQFLKAFRSIINLHIENALNEPDQSLLSSEKYISVLTECLSERTFVIDYQNQYPVSMDMDILKQACPDIDEFKADYVLKAYTEEAIAAIIVNGNSNSVKDTENKNKSTTVHEDQQPSTSKAMIEVADRDTEKEVSSILDVLPHLGDGFIRRVLSRYENHEEAIAAILEGNLPPDLIHSNQQEVYIPPDPQDKLFAETGVKRFNVFDGDKYDIMTQDNPQCIIKREKGFPNQPKTVAALLDDKSHVNEMRHLYQEYSLVTDDTTALDEYNDEYDDSYEAVLETETKRVVPNKLIKTGNLNVIDDDSDQESEEEEEPQTESFNRNTRNFCENPEDVRARYEEQRASKFANRVGNTASKPKGDVVGNKKGQGQEKDTLKSRHKKDVNKSTRANHNRKSGASWKRNKGMIPS